MALREFEDTDGGTWRVWDTNPDVVRGLTREMRNGWLTFDNGSERRRLSPIPTAWFELPRERLLLLVQLAEPARSRGAGDSAHEPERRSGERRVADRRSGDRRALDEATRRRPDV